MSMPMRKNWIVIVVAALAAMVSCKDNEADYRDAWVGVYSYESNRDGGMTGDLEISAYGKDLLSVYVSGIGDDMQMKVEHDGILQVMRQNWWCSDFSGRIGADSIHFEYTICSIPNIRVYYDGKKHSDVVPTSSHAPDYREKWTGDYRYVNNGGTPGVLSVYKVSYTHLGIWFDNVPDMWRLILDVDTAGSVGLVYSEEGWDNIEGSFAGDSLNFRIRQLSPNGYFYNVWECLKIR